MPADAAEHTERRSFAEAYRAAVGSRRPIVPVRLPGSTFRALRAGANLVPGQPYGTVTFEQHLAESAVLRHG